MLGYHTTPQSQVGGTVQWRARMERSYFANKSPSRNPFSGWPWLVRSSRRTIGYRLHVSGHRRLLRRGQLD
jgi:hypothetical protein